MRAVYFADDPCVYCGLRHAHMSIEHVMPISTGGSPSIENQVSACRTCNSRRSNTPLLIWLLHRRSMGCGWNPSPLLPRPPSKRARRRLAPFALIDSALIGAQFTRLVEPTTSVTLRATLAERLAAMGADSPILS